MATFLLATTSVHTTAAACDYLGSRLSADDRVVVLGIEDTTTPDRDLGDAVNVARARLAPATVETERRQGTPSEVIIEVAEEIDADVIVIGPRRGAPDRRGQPGLGSTATAVTADSDRPVVVVPLS